MPLPTLNEGIEKVQTGVRTASTGLAAAVSGGSPAAIMAGNMLGGGISKGIGLLKGGEKEEPVVVEQKKTTEAVEKVSEESKESKQKGVFTDILDVLVDIKNSLVGSSKSDKANKTASLFKKEEDDNEKKVANIVPFKKDGDKKDDDPSMLLPIFMLFNLLKSLGGGILRFITGSGIGAFLTGGAGGALKFGFKFLKRIFLPITAAIELFSLFTDAKFLDDIEKGNYKEVAKRALASVLKVATLGIIDVDEWMAIFNTIGKHFDNMMKSLSDFANAVGRKIGLVDESAEEQVKRTGEELKEDVTSTKAHSEKTFADRDENTFKSGEIKTALEKQKTAPETLTDREKQIVGNKQIVGQYNKAQENLKVAEERQSKGPKQIVIEDLEKEQVRLKKDVSSNDADVIGENIAGGESKQNELDKVNKKLNELRGKPQEKSKMTTPSAPTQGKALNDNSKANQVAKETNVSSSINVAPTNINNTTENVSISKGDTNIVGASSASPESTFNKAVGSDFGLGS